MKTKLFWPRLVLLVLALTSAHVATAQGTAFTYQGRLNDGANPANGIYDLRLSLYDAAGGGVQQGVTLTNAGTAVSNGLFTVTVDFGNQFPGADRWLEIGVRTNGGGAFTALAPRQAITATPYAVRAANAATAATATTASSVAAANIAGTLNLTQLPTTLLTNGASGVNVSGTFSGRVGGLTNYTLATIPATSPRVAASGDFNGDGWNDLLTGGENGVVVMTSNQAGGFAALTNFNVGSLFLYNLPVVDLNGDAKLDFMVVASASGGRFFAFTNNGAGGFSLASSNEVPTANSVIAGDVNGDGKPDAILGTVSTGMTLIHTNNGAGGFTYFNAVQSVYHPKQVAAADVNGDGSTDIITVSENSPPSVVGVFTNNGIGSFPNRADYTVGNTASGLTAADLNADGWVDIATVNSGANTVSVLTNNHSGIFALAATYPVGTGAGQIIARDLTQDGRPELITLNQGGASLTILMNVGTGGFVLAASPSVGPLFFTPSGLTAADLNSDGQLELIVARESANTITVVSYTPTVVTGVISGIGGELTALNASQLTFGTVAEARLSANVALLNRTPQHFTGTNTFGGNVGIGTTDPAAALHLASATQLSERVRLSGAEYYQGNSSTHGLSLLLGVNRTDNRQLWIADSARLGQSAANPALRMHIGSVASIDSIATDGLTSLPLSLGPSALMTLNTNGNVGIGTTSPGTKLDVNGNATTRGFNIVTASVAAPSAGSTLAPTSGYLVLNPGAPVTLNGITAIAAGTAAGQMLILRGNSDANTVTINDNAGTALGGNRVLGANDVLSLIWTGTAWAEISFANN